MYLKLSWSRIFISKDTYFVQSLKKDIKNNSAVLANGWNVPCTCMMKDAILSSPGSIFMRKPYATCHNSSVIRDTWFLKLLKYCSWKLRLLTKTPKVLWTAQVRENTAELSKKAINHYISFVNVGWGICNFNANFFPVNSTFIPSWELYNSDWLSFLYCHASNISKKGFNLTLMVWSKKELIHNFIKRQFVQAHPRMEQYVLWQYTHVNWSFHDQRSLPICQQNR